MTTLYNSTPLLESEKRRSEPNWSDLVLWRNNIQQIRSRLRRKSPIENLEVPWPLSGHFKTPSAHPTGGGPWDVGPDLQMGDLCVGVMKGPCLSLVLERDFYSLLSMRYVCADLVDSVILPVWAFARALWPFSGLFCLPKTSFEFLRIL